MATSTLFNNFQRMTAGQPVSVPDALAPGQPTTTAPLRTLRSISGRHARKYPSAPVNNINGTYAGTYPALAGTAVVPVSEQSAQRITNKISMAMRLATINRRRILNLVEYNSRGPISGDAVTYARDTLRIVPGAPALTRQVFSVGRKPDVRGIFYGQRVAPKAVIDRMRLARPTTQRVIDFFNRQHAANPATGASAQSIAVGTSGGSIPTPALRRTVDLAAQAEDQPGDGGGGENMTGLLYLGAAVFVAFLVLRG